MFKVPHQVYTAEFRGAAAQRIKDGKFFWTWYRVCFRSYEAFNHC